MLDAVTMRYRSEMYIFHHELVDILAPDLSTALFLTDAAKF